MVPRGVNQQSLGQVCVRQQVSTLAALLSRIETAVVTLHRWQSLAAEAERVLTAQAQKQVHMATRGDTSQAHAASGAGPPWAARGRECWVTSIPPATCLVRAATAGVWAQETRCVHGLSQGGCARPWRHD